MKQVLDHGIILVNQRDTAFCFTNYKIILINYINCSPLKTADGAVATESVFPQVLFIMHL